MSTLRVVEQAKRASLMKQATSITKSQMLSVCWPLVGYADLECEFELSHKRGFNGYTGVIGYADSEYDVVNNILCKFVLQR